MRCVAVILVLAALAACGDPAAPAPDGEEGGPHVLRGDFKPASNTARAITGGVTITTGGLIFANGVALYTRTLDPRRGSDLIAKNGDSYAAAALGPGDLSIELRRVTEQSVPQGQVGVCGAADVEYVALAHDARAKSVTLLVFTGADPPGPQAMHSRVCASFVYAPPEGARTREGVVL